MPNLDTTQKLLHPYSKTTHANINQNSQPELHHLPFNDVHLYNIENDIKNTTIINNIKFYSPLFIKNTI
jgi:hypothetical protein